MRFLMINKHLIVVIAIATYPDFRHTVEVGFFCTTANEKTPSKAV